MPCYARLITQSVTVVSPFIAQTAAGGDPLSSTPSSRWCRQADELRATHGRTDGRTAFVCLDIASNQHHYVCAAVASIVAGAACRVQQRPVPGKEGKERDDDESHT